MLAFPGHFGVGLIIAGLTGFNPLLVIIGSLLPDLDAIPVFFGFNYRRNHRTLLHNVFVLSLTFLISLPLAVGYAFHLLVDLSTYPGIRLFHPFSKKEFFILRSNNKKYYNPLSFMKDTMRNKRYLAFEFAIALIGVFIFFKLRL